MDIVKIPFNKDVHSGIILSTWPKGFYYGALNPHKQTKKAWFKTYFEYVKEALLTSHIQMAALKDAADVLIGYSVIREGKLEWVYVKEKFRKNGVARFLVPNTLEYPNMTKIGQLILEKHGKQT